jgi:hypothetical protein
MALLDLGDVTHNNLGQVRKLHSVLFPVHYGDKFYSDLLEAGEYAKLGTLTFYTCAKCQTLNY